MANGYLGKVLWVDLTGGKIKEEALDEKLCRDYIGGYGLGARILFDRMKAGADPLGPENILGFVTGPYTGTQAIGGSRYAVVGKSPLTGTWGDANSGGDFGPYLRFAGYDAVFFTGISKKPVYLVIDNGKAEIKAAGPLWGKDCGETEDLLKNEYGQEAEIACIGPAGEKLSLIAAVINNKGRAAARSGLGAVMGSKKLKAIVAKGKIKIPVFDEAKVNAIRKKYLPLLGGPLAMFRDFGTPAMTADNCNSGDSPVKNWGGVGKTDFPTVEKIGCNAVMDNRQKKYGCYRCMIACGGLMKKGAGDYQYEAGAHKPEYETLAMFGTNCLNDNVYSIIKANDICNMYGLDTISTAAAISMAIECYENGLITKKDTDGIEMTWGNHQSIIAMTEKLAKREGFGAILADGVKKAAERIGKGAEKYAFHIAGQEFPAHDPKLSYSFAIGYRMDATPGRHTRQGGPNPPGLPTPPLPEDRHVFTGRAEAQKVGTCFLHVIEAVGMCQFVVGTFPDASVAVEFLNALTGWNLSMEETLKTGERIANIRHAFNIREGINPLKYNIPGRMVGKPPMKSGPHAGITIDEKTLCEEFCVAMGWDTKTARPSNKKLKELGLEDVAKVI
jgi:aldehyde:ferredoxin oxidoreductase